MGDFSDLMALSDLLKPQDDDVPDPRENKITPYNIHGAAKLPKQAMDRPIGQIVQKDPKAIWDVDEIASDGEDDEEGDLRSRPKHEILYKQDVMTEDVFLGLGDKDPSVAHCDAMVVKIAFPSHSLNEIDLDVTAHKLVAQSHELKLSMFLPNPVKHKEGKARWDAKSETLFVTLPLIKEDW